MRELAKQYESAKKRALSFMQMGEIAAYLDALSEMNKFKRMMIAVAYN